MNEHQCHECMAWFGPLGGSVDDTGIAICRECAESRPITGRLRRAIQAAIHHKNLGSWTTQNELRKAFEEWNDV